jgi:serine/threonine protein kinase
MPMSIAEWLAPLNLGDVSGAVHDAFDALADDTDELAHLSVGEVTSALDKLGLKPGKHNKLLAAHAALCTTTASRSSSVSSKGAAPTQTGDYDIVDKLGSGSFGTVLLAKHRSSDQLVAIKCILTNDAREATQAMREAMKMSELRHPNLVSAVDIYLDEYTDLYLNRKRARVCIVMEYCDGGDLSQLLKASHPLGEARVVSLLAALLSGLAYIHAKGIAHRDIKPANVLLRKDGALKIADYGLARKVDATSVSKGAGTLGYMAPEAFNSAPSPKADIFATAVLAVELASGSPPSGLATSEEAIDVLLRRIPTTYSEGFGAAVRSMLHMDASSRPDAAALLRLQLFQPHATHLATSSSAPLEGVPGSVVELQRFSEQAAWMAPIMIEGLVWEQMAAGVQSVKLCEVRPRCTAITPLVEPHPHTPRATAPP